MKKKVYTLVWTNYSLQNKKLKIKFLNRNNGFVLFMCILSHSRKNVFLTYRIISYNTMVLNNYLIYFTVCYIFIDIYNINLNEFRVHFLLTRIL